MKKQPMVDKLTVSTAQDWAHAHSSTVNSRRRVLQFEAEEIDKSLAAMAAAATNLRARRVRIASVLEGLAQVIAKR